MNKNLGTSHHSSKRNGQSFSTRVERLNACHETFHQSQDCSEFSTSITLQSITRRRHHSTILYIETHSKRPTPSSQDWHHLYTRWCRAQTHQRQWNSNHGCLLPVLRVWKPPVDYLLVRDVSTGKVTGFDHSGKAAYGDSEDSPIWVIFPISSGRLTV